AILFQDADDWSSDDRLALQLDAAERTGAELIGGQEVCFHERERLAFGCAYPLDAGTSLRRRSLTALLHPSTLVSRDLVRRGGGGGARASGGAGGVVREEGGFTTEAQRKKRHPGESPRLSPG